MNNIKEIKNMTREDLGKELSSLEAEFLNVKSDIRAGKEKNVRKGLRIKKNIARIRTVLNQLEDTHEKEN